MLDSLEKAVGEVRRVVDRIDPARLRGPDAARLFEVFAEAERLCAAGKLLAARRVESSNAWREDGHRSLASWVAQKTGTGLGAAMGTVETALRLEGLPGTEDALRSGRLSEAQTREITAAACHRPAAEGELIEAAASKTLTGLKDQCRRVRAAAADEVASYEAVRRSRYLRHWTDAAGAMRLDARLTPDDGARVIAAVEARANELFEEARRGGRREPTEAYAADALVALADGVGADPARGSGVGAVVHVRVDHSAFVRGRVEDGETCEIPGVGPIPVATARRLADDGIICAIVTDGTDVTTVAHLGRTIPAKLRTALVERDPECVVPGCGTRHGLEIDHLVPFAEGGPTAIDNLARLCHWHHYMKTHHGYLVDGGPGTWAWVAPVGCAQGPAPPPP
jgi:hypothetical protein